MKLFILSLVAFLFCVTTVRGAETRDIKTLFADHYTNHYEHNRAGDNVGRFVKAAKKYDLSDGLYLVYVRNIGISVFGFVNVEKARTERFGKLAADEANWNYHAFAMDEEGNVYDFSYSTEPKILPFSEYVEDMFLIETECANPVAGEFCAGREEKLKSYSLETLSAADYLEKKGPKKLPTVTLGKSLEDYTVLTK